MSVASYGPVTAVREDRGRFAALRERRVLVYWPHGFGDWVHLGVLAPLLEPSNRYAVTRFGDDCVSLMEGSPQLPALRSGVRAAGDGGELGATHLGLRLKECNGKPVTLQLPEPLRGEIAEFAPDALLWTDYPETEGRTAYPFHTKARNAARLLVSAERLAALDLSQPLPCTIDFTPRAQTRHLLDERLAEFAPPGTRLCAISRRGVTAARKNWGDGSEAYAFARGFADDWRFVSLDGEDLGERSAGFRALFADIDEPFGHVIRAFARRLDLFVGVPAGPLHFVLARGGVPTVGIWTSHHPDWYDEPNPQAIHLVGRYVRDRKFDKRPATTTKPPALQHLLVYLDAETIGAEPVADAARAVIG